MGWSVPTFMSSVCPTEEATRNLRRGVEFPKTHVGALTAARTGSLLQPGECWSSEFRPALT